MGGAGNISTQLYHAIYYMYLDDNGNSISTGRFGASSHIQLINSPLSSVKCDRPTFSIVQE